mmetsp:Transcript_70281/g.222007  ORF Transcript_70281/g.222007 Transcript_70281/m.222007 type:complete len:366 (-) Transcript_70281:39-1136(-)
MASVTAPMVSGTCFGSMPSFSDDASSVSMMALRAACCTCGRLGWLRISPTTTGSPAMTTAAQNMHFWSFMLSSSSHGDLMRLPRSARTACRGFLHAGACAAMCPSEATAACARCSWLLGPTALTSSATLSSATDQLPGATWGVRTWSTPPSACSVWTTTSCAGCSAMTFRARPSSASAAWGNCCWRLSSSGSHASFAMAARPLATAPCESEACDMTCSTAKTPPTWPRVHIVSLVTLPGSRRPQVTRPSRAPRDRSRCATKALPSTSEVMSCMMATSSDSPSAPAACPALSARKTASSPPCWMKRPPRQGCASISIFKADEHAHNNLTGAGLGRMASKRSMIKASACGHSAVPAFPRSRCLTATS